MHILFSIKIDTDNIPVIVLLLTNQVAFSNHRKNCCLANFFTRHQSRFQAVDFFDVHQDDCFGFRHAGF